MAVQVKSIESNVGLLAARSLTSEGGILSFSKALLTFNLPPVDVIPASDGTGSTLHSIRALILSLVRVGCWALINATVPATCGVAMEVPLQDA